MGGGSEILSVRVSEPGDAIEKKLIRGIRAGLGDALKAWQREMVPARFETGAERRYGFSLRTKRYQIRKARVMGHQRPNVWTGTTYEWVRTRFAAPTVRKENGVLKGRLPLKTPTYFYQYKKTSYDKAAEFRNTTESEAQTMKSFVDAAIQKSLATGRRRG